MNLDPSDRGVTCFHYKRQLYKLPLLTTQVFIYDLYLLQALLSRFDI